MIQRRNYIQRSTKPLKRKPIKREGISGKAKRLFREGCKRQYFGAEMFASCQLCGREMSRLGGDAHAHHKLKRSLRGKDEYGNIVILHWKCHAQVHRVTQLYELVRDSEVNMLNRGVMMPGERVRHLFAEVDEFRSILNDARTESKGEWEDKFTKDMCERFERYGPETMLTEKQLTQLKSIAARGGAMKYRLKMDLAAAMAGPIAGQLSNAAMIIPKGSYLELEASLTGLGDGQKIFLHLSSGLLFSLDPFWVEPWS